MKVKDYEEKTQKTQKQSNIAKFAKYSTLSDAELEQANSTDGVDYEDADDEYENYDEVNEDGDFREIALDDSEEQGEPEEENEPRMEHIGEVLTFQSKPTEQDILRFMARHTYLSVLGILACVMAVVSLVVSIIEFTHQQWVLGIAFLAVFYLFAIQSPLNLKKKAHKQSQEMSRPEGIITYTFSEAGFDMERGKEYAPYHWSRILKVINGKTGYYVYLEKNRAFIATKADLGVNEQKFVRMLEKHVDKYKAPKMENI